MWQCSDDLHLVGGKRLHLVISDSRIAGIGDLVKGKGSHKEEIEFRMRKGASFGEMADSAIKHLGKCPFDIVYIAGGICDITSKDHESGAISLEWADEEDLKSHLVGALNRANVSRKKYLPASRIVFCPLVGCDLKQVVNVHKISEDQQEMVNNAIWEFNSRIFRVNEENSAFSPSLHQSVHRICNEKRRNYYYHLEDGLHLSDFLKNKWADQFIKAMAHN